MPKVNNTEYPYTPKGMAAAKKARKDLVARPDYTEAKKKKRQRPKLAIPTY